MAKIHLLDEEKILATDDVRQFSLGIISFNAECTITNKRLLLFPKGAMDKLTGERTEIFLKSIKDIQGKGLPLIFHIISNSGTTRITGSGAERICDRLHKILSKEKDISSEKVILQGDSDVYIKGRLSTNGEFILSNKKLIVRTKGGLEGLIFSAKELVTPLTKIKNIKYAKVEQRLTIKAESGTITLGGKAANRLHAALLVMEGSSVDELESDLQIFKVLHYKGATRAANQGELSFTKERVIFTPSSTIDTMTGASLRYIPLGKINRLSKEKNLVIDSTKDSLEFITNEKDQIFSELLKKMQQIKTKNLFIDIRDKNYSEEEAYKQVSLLKFPFNWQYETPLLISWSTVLLDDNVVYALWFFVTNHKTRLIDPDFKIKWEASNALVSIIENRRASDHTLQLLVKGKRFKIIPSEGLGFSKFYLRKVKESRPSESEQFARQNQSVSRVLGMSQLVIFSNEEARFHVVHNTRVTKQVRGLQVNSERLDSFPLSEGDDIFVEVPKEDGRFRFESKITELHLVNPDPVGRYYITLAIPKSISLFNDRGAYRAPFAETVQVTIFALPDYDSEREDPNLIHTDDWNELSQLEMQLEDISVGGCGGFFKRSLKSFKLPFHQIALVFSMQLNDETIDFKGVARYELQNNPDRSFISYRVGIEFFGISHLQRSLINREVLKIEREQIRKELENKT
jgi:hypothetical protein